MGLCDAHQGMADNMERLMNGQDKLFDLQRETANDIKGMSVNIVQLSEGQVQGEQRLAEFKADTAIKLEAILAEVKKTKRKTNPAKMIAIVASALLGGGGLTAFITAIRAGGKTP